MELRQEHRMLLGEAVYIRRYTSDDLEQTVYLWRASKRAAYPYVAAQQRSTLEDFIDQLYVAVEQQRRGVGTALLQKAREQSSERLRLYTFQKNLSARAFYEKHGFQAVRYGFSPAPEHEPDVEYHWR